MLYESEGLIRSNQQCGMLYKGTYSPQGGFNQPYNGGGCGAGNLTSRGSLQSLSNTTQEIMLCAMHLTSII
jgi:hypothetical protein